MSRYRPPPEKKSPYITLQGFETLKSEETQLWKKRHHVVRILSEAAAEGDRSENAEYIYRKKQLRELDRRLRYLQKRLPELKVVRDPPDDVTRIFFGARVTLEDDSGDAKIYRIVGPDEFDPKKNWISMDSPLAKCLMGKTMENSIELETPSGRKELHILEVSYCEYPS